VILTGPEIHQSILDGRVVIEPFNAARLEPNSYGFHLGEALLAYTDAEVNAFEAKTTEVIQLPEEGYVLEPHRFYLGSTLERMGSPIYASELYARLSTALCGIFIQTSAPLGHTGGIIRWTLEIVVAHQVRVYPRMLIGKICFWRSQGAITPYTGRYQQSPSVVQSLLSWGDP
jgi:dCTP deaminase